MRSGASGRAALRSLVRELGRSLPQGGRGDPLDPAKPFTRYILQRARAARTEEERRKLEQCARDHVYLLQNMREYKELLKDLGVGVEADADMREKIRVNAARVGLRVPLFFGEPEDQPSSAPGSKQ